jgi:hypothetical protein
MTEEKVKDMHKQIMGIVGNRTMMSLIRDGRRLQQQDPTIVPIMLDNFQNVSVRLLAPLRYLIVLFSGSTTRGGSLRIYRYCGDRSSTFCTP